MNEINAHYILVDKYKLLNIENITYIGNQNLKLYADMMNKINEKKNLGYNGFLFNLVLYRDIFINDLIITFDSNKFNKIYPYSDNWYKIVYENLLNL